MSTITLTIIDADNGEVDILAEFDELSRPPTNAHMAVIEIMNCTQAKWTFSAKPPKPPMPGVDIDAVHRLRPGARA